MCTVQGALSRVHFVTKPKYQLNKSTLMRSKQGIFNWNHCFQLVHTCPAERNILLAVVVTSPRVCETLSASFSSSSVSGYKPHTLSDGHESTAGAVCDGCGERGREMREEPRLLNSPGKYLFLMQNESWFTNSLLSFKCWRSVSIWPSFCASI